jgi:pimeloyl-ACP methyl ester carboxylesterase
MSGTDRDLKARSRYVDVNDVRLHCEEFGAGQPLVLLHGGLGSGRDWEHLVPSLADDFHVVTIDVRGHGRSTNPSGVLTYPLIASDLALAIEVLELDRPIVAGWSDGGQHALQLGARYPELPHALVVGAADYQSSSENKRWVREFFGLNDEGDVDLEILDQMLGPSASHYHAKHPGGASQWHELARQTAHLWLDYDGLSDEEYHRISAPVLVMVGDRDEDVPVEDAVSMYRAIPNAELAVCPGADHFIPWRRPDWLIATTRAFLERRSQDVDVSR